MALFKVCDEIFNISYYWSSKIFFWHRQRWNRILKSSQNWEFECPKKMKINSDNDYDYKSNIYKNIWPEII